ncbi:DNA topology modulation protein [Paenibacillus glycanilyticus]|uniref:DNA topology modulation protein n=1 Tax=Paenibacillus glycanilyticus TaxID=126569 RepID=UPI00203AA52B|nr:DNA topology modulation protein [Paenibacillus glycanilyticus]MCM3627389.1 DNA topology modulation protein [Paenibacillus glycanilyticus]
MKKIAIIGSGGAGKSTLARKLGKLLDQEVSHLDAMFWKANWVSVPKEEQIRVQSELVQQDKWIIDGNYGGTMDIRLHAADTIVYLDFPRLLCMYRAVKRAIQYRNRARPDMGPDCREKVDLPFLKWIWEYPKTRKPEILSKIQQLSGEKQVIILKSPGEADRFLKRLGKDKEIG